MTEMQERSESVGQSSRPPVVTEPHFREVEGRLIPSPHTRGPWSGGTLNGRFAVAALARAIEREHVSAGFHCTRLTTDLFRPPPVAPFRVTTRVVRSGGRLRAVDAELDADGVVVARAGALILRQD